MTFILTEGDLNLIALSGVEPTEKEKEFIDWMCKKFGPGVGEVPGAWDLSLLGLGGVNCKYLVEQL